MVSLPSSLARAVRQLADPAILRVLAKSIVATLGVFVAFGVLLYVVLGALITEAGWAPVNGAMVLLTLAATVLLGWILFRIVALAVIQFFAEDIIHAVEARYYPGAAQTARTLTFRESLADGTRSALRALGVNLLFLPVALALLFTGIGTVALFWAVNAWLLGGDLQEMAWARHRLSRQDAAPIGGGTRFLLGGAIAALFTVPFVNLLAPVIGAAAATHLVQAGKLRNSTARPAGNDQNA